MKTIQLLKTAGSIACVAFALNATAQTTTIGSVVGVGNHRRTRR